MALEVRTGQKLKTEHHQAGSVTATEYHKHSLKCRMPSPSGGCWNSLRNVLYDFICHSFIVVYSYKLDYPDVSKRERGLDSDLGWRTNADGRIHVETLHPIVVESSLRHGGNSTEHQKEYITDSYIMFSNDVRMDK